MHSMRPTLTSEDPRKGLGNLARGEGPDLWCAQAGQSLQKNTGVCPRFLGLVKICITPSMQHCRAGRRMAAGR